MKTILVPTDFSDAAMNACMYAAGMASAMKASICLLNVYHIPNPLPTLPIEIIITPGELKNDTESMLEEVKREMIEKHPGLTVELMSRNGSTAKEIKAAAEYIHAEMIIMGAKGKGKTALNPFGSSALDVISDSSIPVILVPVNFIFSPIKSVLFASYSEDIPEEFNPTALYHILNSFTPELTFLTILSRKNMASRDEIIHRINKWFIQYRHSHIFRENAEVEEGIRDYVLSTLPDLLVMISKKHSFLDYFVKADLTRYFSVNTDLPLIVMK